MAKSSPYTAAGAALQKAEQNRAPTIADQLNHHRAFLDARLKQLGAWVRQGVDPRALVRFTLMDMQTNAKLRECTPMSIYLGLLACAVTGLEPGALKGEAYLVPFRNNRIGVTEATFIPGWKGLVKQMRRSREVIGVTANVVRGGDVFEMDLGTANTLVHRPSIGNEESGDVLGAYAIGRMAGGHNEVEWMPRTDLDKIRAINGDRSDAWKEWPDQMARKTPIRRLAKRMPLGGDYFVGLALEQAIDNGASQVDVLDVETDGAASKAIDQADVAPPGAVSPDEAREIEEAERKSNA